MKVLLVIHGYPMRYNAGSEVYTQGLAQALAERHEVHVFTRQQNKFLPDYVLSEETDPLDARVKLHVINLTQTLDQYRHVGVDRQFGALLDVLKPDVVHIGHLNHISTSLVLEASRRNIPLVYTLHDYWLMCPRGQFIQIRPKDQTDLWPLCDGQEDRKCAERCYARYFSGAPEEEETDIVYWTDWVHRRMTHIREICGATDLFIALQPNGKPAYQACYGYAGDYRDGIAVVQGENGLHTHINLCGEPVHGHWFLDLDVFHKGYARARDTAGWHHIDLQGYPIYARRFAAVEPFYNGQARVEDFDGSLLVIDQEGVMIVRLRNPL